MSKLIRIMFIIMNFLDTYSNLIIAIATLALAIITTIYVLLTRRILLDNRIIIEKSIEPKIVIFYEPMENNFGCFSLIIKNIGGGAAFDIKLKISPDIECIPTEHKFLSKTSLFKDGLKFLPPGEKRNIYLTAAAAIKKDIENNKGSHKGEISYKNIANKEYKDIYYIDFNYVKDLYKTTVIDTSETLKRLNTKKHKP